MELEQGKTCHLQVASLLLRIDTMNFTQPMLTAVSGMKFIECLHKARLAATIGEALLSVQTAGKFPNLRYLRKYVGVSICTYDVQTLKRTPIMVKRTNAWHLQSLSVCAPMRFPKQLRASYADTEVIK